MCGGLAVWMCGGLAVWMNKLFFFYRVSNERFCCGVLDGGESVKKDPLFNWPSDWYNLKEDCPRGIG